MACEAGADFNAENATKMISDWQKLITAESLFGVWGYVPASDTNAFGDTLCKELLGIEISKNEQTSDWSLEELSEEQKNYAAPDVLHLHKLKSILEDKLEKDGKK